MFYNDEIIRLKKYYGKIARTAELKLQFAL